VADRPRGAAVGGALGFRLLTRFGLSGTDAAFAMAAQGVGSVVVLNLLLWVGLLGSIVGGSYNPLYATAALVGVLLLAGFSAVVLLLMRGERRAAEVMRRWPGGSRCWTRRASTGWFCGWRRGSRPWSPTGGGWCGACSGTCPSGCARPPPCGCSWPRSATGRGSTG
jgi:hypothetical protein